MPERMEPTQSLFLEGTPTPPPDFLRMKIANEHRIPMLKSPLHFLA